MFGERKADARHKDEENLRLNAKLNEVLRHQQESNSQIAKLTGLLSELQQSNFEKEKRIKVLLKEIFDL